MTRESEVLDYAALYGLKVIYDNHDTLRKPDK